MGPFAGITLRRGDHLGLAAVFGNASDAGLGQIARLAKDDKPVIPCSRFTARRMAHDLRAAIGNRDLPERVAGEKADPSAVRRKERIADVDGVTDDL